MAVLYIYKPYGLFSKEMYTRYLPKIKCGHVGTLDQYAKGLLILLTGESTKLSYEINNADKQYVFNIILGVSTDTDDLVGNILETNFNYTVLDSDIVKLIDKFNGKWYKQHTPIYSSRKIGGKKFYNLVNNEELSKIIAKHYANILIKEFKVLHYSNFSMTVSVQAGSGFYARAFARDVGKFFNCFGTASNIFRVKFGNKKYFNCINFNHDECTNK